MRLYSVFPSLGKSKEKLRKSRAGFKDRTFATLEFIDFRVTSIVGREESYETADSRRCKFKLDQ